MKKLFLLFGLIIALFDITTNAHAVDYPFSVITTSISAGGTFSFTMTAKGTFEVDCGSGGTLSGTGVSGTTIDRSSNTSYTTYTCTYSSSGVKTIRFGGLATGYVTTCCNGDSAAINFNRGTPTLVASISGSLGTIFPTLGSSASQQPKFISTFNGTGITTIPEDLFNGVTGSVEGMFDWTFYGCTRLTSIPENLFRNITGGSAWMFSGVFRNCTALTVIPDNLFAGITNNADGLFSNAFNGCTNLRGYIPYTIFSGLITNGSPYVSTMMDDIFYNTGLSISCPSGTVQYITGYESYWNNKVSCGIPITCSSGYYLPIRSTSCAACLSGYICPGGTYGLDVTMAQGITETTGVIGLTWDGATMTPASCSLGSTFVPPTPAARPGYRFTGWKIKSINAIPATYTKLEYIQTNGNQYINVGLSSNGIGLSVETKVMFLDTYQERTILGREAGGGFDLYTNSEPQLGLWNNSSSVIRVSISQNTLYTISAGMTSSGITMTVNGTNYSGAAPQSMSAANLNLFRHNYTSYAKLKMYYLKLYNNGTLVRDFIPAKRNSDNVVGMYDTVSGNFFTNAGTGSFTAGPAVQ